MVAGGKQCSSRSTITPTKTCSADIYRHIKRRVGRSLKHTERGTWSVPESKLHINHFELKAVFMALKEFQDLCSNNIVLVATDNTTVVAYINKEGGMKSGSLCALLWRILSWCTRKQVTLKAHHIPGRLNVIADKLSRLGQTIQTEWSLHPEVFKAICSRWHQPQLDLFATRFNYHTLYHRFQTPRHGQWMHSACHGKIWTHLGKVVEKLQDYPCNRIILIAPGWPNMPWFWDLVAMSSQIPRVCQPAQSGVPTIQPDPAQELVKPEPTCLAPRATAIKEQGFSEALAARIEAPQRGSTRSVYEAKWTIFTKWCRSNQVDFRAPPLKAIADFLLHLFQDRKLQPSTTDGYRSAIADKLGNSTINVSKDENLPRLLDSFHRDRPKGRRGIPSWNLSLVLHQLTKAPFEPLKEASLKHLIFKIVFLLALVNAGGRSMLGFTRISDTSQTGLRCPCTLHPAFYPRISWLRRAQIVWLQWSYQPWPPLWISHSRVTGLCVQSQPLGITWTGLQILGRTRSWSLSPSRKVLVKSSHLPPSPHGSNKL